MSRLIKALRWNLRTLFLTRFLLKATSLVLAILLWHAISTTDITSAELQVPIIYSSSSEMYIEKWPKKITATLRGPVREIESLTRNARRLSAKLDIQETLNKEPLQEFFTIDAMKELNFDTLPPSVEILAISPPRIRFKIERAAQKYVHVKLLINGQVAQGFELESKIQVDPSEVVVRGRSSLVNRLASIGYIRTRPIDLDGRRSTDEWQSSYIDLQNLPLKINKSLKESIKCDPSRVKVHIVIRPKLQTKIFQNIPIKLLGVESTNYKIRLEKKQINVYVRGIESDLVNIVPNRIRVFIDTSRFSKPGKSKLVPEVNLPKNVSLDRKLEAISCTVERLKESK